MNLLNIINIYFKGKFYIKTCWIESNTSEAYNSITINSANNQSYNTANK